MVSSSTTAFSSGLEIDSDRQTDHTVIPATDSTYSRSQNPSDFPIQAPITTDNNSITGSEVIYDSEIADTQCQNFEETNDSSILQNSCISNSSLLETLNSSEDDFLSNLFVCSSNFLEAGSSLIMQTAQNEISDLGNVRNTQLPANASEEIWFKKKGLNIMHLNIHYLYSKLDEIKILLSQQPNIDILCFCDTFLNDQFSDDELSLENYQLFRKDRKTNGGGLAVYIKSNLLHNKR